MRRLSCLAQCLLLPLSFPHDAITVAEAFSILWRQRNRQKVAAGATYATATPRGFDQSRYGENRSIPLPNEVAAKLGIQPLTKAPSFVWSFVWRWHSRLLWLLHLGDSACPKDSSKSLKVLWNKAMVACDKRSPVYDAEGWTMDLLPRHSRWICRLGARFFPRLHHGNIELRMTYLEQQVQRQIQALPRGTPVRLISVGSGYDVSSTKWLSQGLLHEAWELDLPVVIESKQVMLNRLRSRRQRRTLPRGPNLTTLPFLRQVDLNDFLGFRAALDDILSLNKGLHTIFIFEGVLIYVDSPSKVLQTCSDACRNASSTAGLVFADRLANVPGGDNQQAIEELESVGWTLTDWCPKPGLARHMGTANLL